MKIHIYGDLAPSETNLQEFAHGAYQKVFTDIVEYNSKSDFNIVNLETAISDRISRVDKSGPQIVAPLSLVDTIQKAGFHVVSVANNHALDNGLESFRISLNRMEERSIRYVGVDLSEKQARWVILEKDGIRTGILAIGDCEYNYDAEAGGVNIFRSPETYFEMQFIFSVPMQHLTEIQVLWILIFGSFTIELLATVFRVSTFITNKIYLSSLATMIGVGIRTVIVVAFLYFAGCKIWFIGLGSLISALIQMCLHVIFSAKLTPQFRINLKDFHFSNLIEILSSGVWNTITQLGKLLSEGLDLVIANIIIGAQGMGVLSISKVLSTYVQTFIGSIANTMLPQLTFFYSKNDMANYHKQLYRDMDLLSLMSCFALIVLYTLGTSFYHIWVPSQDANQLMMLTFFGSFWMCVSGVMGSIFNAFTVQNKLKYNSMFMLISGIVSTLLLLVVLYYTDLGIYAVAGISSIVYMLKNIFLIIPYAEKHVGISKRTVYRKVAINFILVFTMVVLQRYVLQFFAIEGWLSFAISGIFSALFTITVLVLVLVSKEQRNLLVQRFIKRRARR